MIGKVEWFKKKSFGWGLTPKTWQGWTYVLVFIVLLIFLQFLSDYFTRAVMTFVLIGLFVADSIHITIQMKKMEKEENEK